MRTLILMQIAFIAGIGATPHLQAYFAVKDAASYASLDYIDMPIKGRR